MSETKSFNFDDGNAVEIEDNLAPVHDFDKTSEVTGYYLGSEEEVGKNGSTVYRIETENGIVAIWDTTQLHRLMESIKKDDFIKITYIGEEPTKNPEFKFKRFTVSKRG